ncbi:hypothetical protein VTH06DRAFT_2804 [Thermothelomyces fergusii]
MTTPTVHDTQMQEPCTVSFVDTTHDSPSPHTSCSVSSSPALFSAARFVSGLSLGLALFFTSSSCSSSSTSNCDGTALDWALLGSLMFQLYFFATVVRQELRGCFACLRVSNVFQFWFWLWVYIRNWLGKRLRIGNWNLGRSSIAVRPWARKHGNASSSFRRLG